MFKKLKQLFSKKEPAKKFSHVKTSYYEERTLFFVDDERRVIDVTWVDYGEDSNVSAIKLCPSFEIFKKRVENCKIVYGGWRLTEAVYSFDHDLQDFHYTGGRNSEKIEYTGYDCVKWFVDYCFDNGIPLPKRVYFHSKNPVGVENMRCYYENARKFQGL